MLHHLEIYVSDLGASRQFWKNLLAPMGYVERDHWDDGFTLGDGKDAYLTFLQRLDKYAAHEYHRCGVGLNHLAFRVESRDAVDAIRRYCVEQGITNLYDDQYPFANGGSDYYALFVEDPDRIKVEFVSVQAGPGHHC